MFDLMFSLGTTQLTVVADLFPVDDDCFLTSTLGTRVLFDSCSRSDSYRGAWTIVGWKGHVYLYTGVEG
jgi:hypothetical protein